MPRAGLYAKLLAVRLKARKPAPDELISAAATLLT
jgi:hypothetical protein